VEVIFDPIPPRGPDADEQFEKAVQLCAALVWRLHEMGADVEFSSSDTRITAPPQSQRIYEILQWLAVVRPAERRGGSENVLRQQGSKSWGYRFVFTSLDQQPTALQSGEGRYVLFEQL
jgi:hypothetical protein